MRFIYIDSQGNEINIPSVDALRLRIELGAIVDTTMFHDSNTGKWGPAGEHEIYRTLQRELSELESGGFVAPPPAAEGPPVDRSQEPLPLIEPWKEDNEADQREEEARRKAEEEARRKAEEEARRKAEEEARRKAEEEARRKAEEEARKEEEGLGLGVDIGLNPEVEALPEEPDTPASPRPDAPPAAESSEDTLGLAELDLADEPEEEDVPDQAEGDTAKEDDLVFETMEHGVAESAAHVGEDEPAPAEPESPNVPADEPASAPAEAPELASAPESAPAEAPEPVSPPESTPTPDSIEDIQGVDLAEGVDVELGLAEPEPPRFTPMDDVQESMAALPQEDEEEEEPPASGGFGGLDLEPSLADEYEGGGPPPPGVDLDAPLSDYDADQPPDWMQDSTSPDEWESGPEVGEEPPRVEQPAPPPARPARPRSAPPQRKLTRARTPGLGRIIGLLVGVVAIGAGGWFGWQALTGGGDDAAEEVQFPVIAEHLMPQMTQSASQALQGVAEAIAGLPAGAAIPEQPDRAWLTGPYLSGASGYPSVPAYWNSVLTYLEAIEATEAGFFEVRLDGALSEVDLTPADAAQIRARAVAGFEASSGERRAVHEQLRSVALAALALHEFLVQNEAQIVYDPPQDPVWEVVPATDALRTAMLDRIGMVTNALDNLGFLDTITTDGLIGTYLDKLAAVPVR